MLAKEFKVLVSWYSFMLFFKDFLAIFSSDMQHWKQLIISRLQSDHNTFKFLSSTSCSHNLEKTWEYHRTTQMLDLIKPQEKTSKCVYKLRYYLENGCRFALAQEKTRMFLVLQEPGIRYPSHSSFCSTSIFQTN